MGIPAKTPGGLWRYRTSLQQFFPIPLPFQLQSKIKPAFSPNGTIHPANRYQFQLRAYHSLPRHCRPSSPSPRHRESCEGYSGSFRRTGERSPPAAWNIPLHPSGPDSEKPRHTPGSILCTSCRGHTGTGLERTHHMIRIVSSLPMFYCSGSV